MISQVNMLMVYFLLITACLSKPLEYCLIVLYDTFVCGLHNMPLSAWVMFIILVKQTQYQLTHEDSNSRDKINPL